MAAATTAAGVGSAKSAQQGFADLPVAGKLFILVLILFAISTIYFFAFHQGLSADIENAQSQHAQLETGLVEAQHRHQEFLRVTQELANREGVDRHNKRILPERAEIPAFLQDLNRIAELAGLSILVVHPLPETGADHYVKLPVELTLSGHFHQFAKFFYNVSQLERAVSMENVSLKLEGRPAGPAAQQQAAANPTGIPDVPLRMTVLATTFRRGELPPAEGAANARGRRSPGRRGAAAAPAGGGAR